MLASQSALGISTSGSARKPEKVDLLVLRYKRGKQERNGASDLMVLCGREWERS